jgi:hypothetical protein
MKAAWLPLFLLCTFAQAADFDLAFSYAQSRDFWRTVQAVQDRTGNLPEIQSVVKDKYGRPDVLYSFLDASYAQEYFESELLSHYSFGTRAEALGGGEISNPISPEIQAYANSIGILSVGLRGKAELHEGSALRIGAMAGLGPEKRLFAQGAEFIEAIPVRSGILMLAGLEGAWLNRSDVGGDFWITSDFSMRAVYFHSTTPSAKSRAEDNAFATLRWRLQNEWLKEWSGAWHIGIISVLGQNPFPFLTLPVSWDYQQRLQIFPGISSVSGGGAILRLLPSQSTPSLALYGGIFGGAIGAGLDLQFGSFLVNASSYALENTLTPAGERTRLWSASVGVAL